MVVRLVRVFERTVADFDGIRAPRNREDRRGFAVFREMLRKALRVDRRRRDDHLQVAALREEALQVPQQKVDVDGALVRFVNDHRVVGEQKRIRLRLREQDPVRHQLDRGAGRRGVREAHLEADDVPEGSLEFFRDALRDRARRDATGLRMGDAARNAAPGHERDLGELRRFARARLAAYDDDAVFFDRALHFIRAHRDGEVRRQFKRRNGRLDLRKRKTRTLFSAGGLLGVAVGSVLSVRMVPVGLRVLGTTLAGITRLAGLTGFGRLTAPVPTLAGAVAVGVPAGRRRGLSRLIGCLRGTALFGGFVG